MDPIEVLEHIRVLWLEGHNVQQICVITGRGSKFVVNRLNDLGLKQAFDRRRYGQSSCRVCTSTFQKESTRHELCQTCIPDRTAKIFWQRYRITRPQHVDLYESQKGLCRLCFQSIVFAFDPKERFSVVDHDHATGRVRGLLCGKCNWAVGVFETRMRDAVWMSRMLEYVKHGSD